MDNSKTFRLLNLYERLNRGETVNKKELEALIYKLLLQATPSAQMNIKEMIINEKFHYIPLKHNRPLLSHIWNLSECIYNKNIIEFDYKRQDQKITHRTVKPLSVMFSEYYFYLIAWFADDSKNYPAVFRIDRIPTAEIIAQDENKNRY